MFTGLCFETYKFFFCQKYTISALDGEAPTKQNLFSLCVVNEYSCGIIITTTTTHPSCMPVENNMTTISA